MYELLKEGFGFAVSFSSPRLIVWGIFSWDLIFEWKVHVSVQGSYKHKITNNNFCFGNKATILLKIFQKIVQAGQSHQGRFKPSGYSPAKGIRWEQEALSTKLHDMKEICYNSAYSGVPENIQQEESSEGREAKKPHSLVVVLFPERQNCFQLWWVQVNCSCGIRGNIFSGRKWAWLQWKIAVAQIFFLCSLQLALVAHYGKGGDPVEHSMALLVFLVS